MLPQRPMVTYAKSTAVANDWRHSTYFLMQWKSVTVELIDGKYVSIVLTKKMFLPNIK